MWGECLLHVKLLYCVLCIAPPLQVDKLKKFPNFASNMKIGQIWLLVVGCGVECVCVRLMTEF